VDDADPNGAVVEAQALHDLDRVVVAVPHGEAALTEPRCCFLRRERVVRDREGRHASLHRRDAVQAPRVGEALEELLPALPLVLEHEVPADLVLQVLDRRDEAREQLVRERARLEAVPDREVVGRPDLVRAHALGEVPLHVREAEVRAVELVRRADEDVGARRLHVDRAVRPVVHRIDPRKRAGVVRERRDLRDRRDGPHRVRRPRERYDARAIGEERPEMIDVEPAFLVDLGELDDEAPVVRELEPGRDVAVVVESRAHDLVAFVPGARRGTRQSEVQRRHVRAESDLVDGRIEEVRGGCARLREQGVGAPRRAEWPVGVRVRVPEVVADRVDHGIGHLRTTRAVEECEGLLQRGEACAHRLDGRHDTCHWYSGFSVSDAPTKQSRSAFSIRSSTSFVRGVSCASMRTSISTNR
jgi:hypothetical protein